MMAQVFSIIICLATLLAVALYLASGFRHSLFLKVVIASVMVIGYCEYAMGENDLRGSVLFGICASVLLFTILHNEILNTDDPAEEKYFDFLSYGIVIFAVPVVIKIVRVGIGANDIWFILVVVMPILSHVCRKSGDRHYQTFLASGVLVVLLATSCILIRPLLSGDSITADSILMSIKLGGCWFILPGAFFLANYAKSGLLTDKSIHKKVFGVYAVLIVMVMMTRFPSLQPFKDLPGVGALAVGSSIGMLVFPASVGLVFRRKDHNTQQMHPPDKKSLRP